ncbi:YhfH family protein [Viridibacillus sp. FSL R5-0477]|jgi:ribosomal protein L37AE/L43A|nr:MULTISPECIES: YhfH family protein [Viridibacillus]
MKTTKQEVAKKHCRECGCVIVERVESTLYECERCIGINEE